ncbi:TPA: hypothetical protein RSW69_003203 [Vibrio cholerae]|nr:hypothetical protein [Vibrio cholerae]HDZ3781896.1 hypothetical protein [Vibrio cholerae]HDZ3785776.1 hypothetical protein [Vibrio cholerae]
MSELKSQPITKEMWQQIEKEMSDGWVNIVFAYKGHELTVNRVRESESKTCLQVYVDGLIKGEWVSFNGDNCLSDKAPVILPDVWCKKTKAKHTSKFKQDIIRIFGKREAKKRYPDFDDSWCFYVPHFSKASVLCRQYKKLEGIELVSAHFVKAEGL